VTDDVGDDQEALKNLLETLTAAKALVVVLK